MKLILIALLMASPLFAQFNERVGANLTIYNQDFGVVNEKLEAELTSGSQLYRIDNLPKLILPETIRLKYAGKVLEQSFNYDVVNFYDALQKSIGSNITIENSQGIKYSGTLTAVTDNQIILLNSDKSLTMLPKDPNYIVKFEKLSENISTAPRLNFILSPDKPGKQKLNLTYHTESIAWNVNYFLNVSEDETKASLDAFFNITNNTGVTFKDANVNLVFGKVNRNIERPNLYAKEYLADAGLLRAASVSNTFSKDYSDVFEYKLPQKISLLNNESKQIEFFSASNIKIKKKLYVYSSPYINARQDMQVESVYLIDNKKENGLGMLLPLGVFRVSKGNAEAGVFIGDSREIDIPINQTGEITTGSAYNLIANEQITKIDYTDNDAIKTIEYVIKNNKQEDADITLLRLIESNMQVLECSQKFSFDSGNRMMININLKKGEETKIKLKIKEIPPRY